jgi:hypothetical protein
MSSALIATSCQEARGGKLVRSKRLGFVGFFLVVALPLLQACDRNVTNSCVCVGRVAGGACGNDAIGGSHGQVFTGLATDAVIGSYKPDRIGPQASGWACLPEASNTCVCIGIPTAVGTCGNGAIGGSNGQIVTKVPTPIVIASYGPDRIGTEATGWKCRPSTF